MDGVSVRGGGGTGRGRMRSEGKNEECGDYFSTPPTLNKVKILLPKIISN
jgi:hypothetical protein